MKKHHGEKYRFRDTFLREGEENILRPIRNSPLTIFFQNTELRYTRICNPLPGMEKKDVIGKRDEELFSPENAFRLTVPKKRALEGATLIKEEVTLAHEGEEFFFEMSVEQVRDKSGAVTGIAGAMVDITDRRRVEVTLSKSEELLRRFFDAIPDLISVQDRNLRILFSNWHGGYDYVPAETRESHPFCYDAYYPGSGKPCEPCHVLEAFRTGKIATVEKINPRIGHIEAHAYPVFDDAGEVVMVMEHIRDITERKRAQERLEKMKEVFLGFGADADENISRLVALCGEQLQADYALYTRLDEDLLKTVGRWNTPADLPYTSSPDGQLSYDVINSSPESLWVQRDLSESVYTETDPHVERYGIKTYMGKPVSLGSMNIGAISVVYRQDRDPADDEKQLLGIIAGAIGIEEKRRRAENELRLLNADLEQRVAERTAELEITNRELEAFNYSVSHDLHAPLMILEGFSRELINRYAHRLDKDGCYYLERIQAAGKRMEGLIDSILMLSTLSRSMIRKEQVDLGRMGLLFAADQRQREPERSVEFIIAKDLFVKGDKRLLKIAMENLFNNAWKYTAKKETARIQFDSLDKEGERIFFIRDNGVGFAMERADALFIPFERLHSREEFPGHGIGLATVKRIIEHHGGRVWAEGKPDEGATFYFTLP